MKLAPATLRDWLALPLRVMAMLALLAASGVAVAFLLTTMPGQSATGPLPTLSKHQLARQERLRHDVVHLASTIGERHVHRPDRLELAARHIEGELRSAGWAVSAVGYECRGLVVRNVVAERRGISRPQEVVLLGAHYDSVERSAGADDNASGVAVLLEFARSIGSRPLARTVRLVAFVNEEPPWFRSPLMGSRIAARQFAARGDRLTDVVVLDAIGYFCDDPCQRYPPLLDWFFPKEGNFIAFVGRARDWLRLRDVVGTFRRHASVPSEGLAAPRWVPGIDYSDHAEFWDVGYPGILVTDAPTYRNEHYHRHSDLPETVDFDRLTRVADGIVAVIAELASR
ncbi:MAG: M28 family peptidase [Deltaproteobacteria bacterium]|nr:M28 family peptidase [Deltaproteobacteria bacterium]